MSNAVGMGGAWVVGLLAFSLLAGCGASRSSNDGGSHESPNAGGGGGEGSAPPEPPGPAGITESAFAVTASVELAEPDDAPSWQGCTSFDLTARIAHDDDAGWVLVAAVSGEQNGAKLAASGSGYRALEMAEPRRPRFVDPDVLLQLPMGECCERLYITDFSLSPEADAGAGSWRGFAAAGAGRVSTEDCGGDTYSETDVRVTWQAGPDRLAPRVHYPPAPLHPFDRVELPFSEVVSGDLRASLIDTRKVELPLERWGFLEADGPFWGFRAGPLLSFGRVANLDVGGEDPAGNAFVERGHVASVDDPGVLAADGFEGGVTALTEAQLRLVTEGAITGTRSLQIGTEDGSSGRVTFHLRSAEPASFVRFNAKNLRWAGDDDEESAGVRASAAALGGSEIVSQLVPLRFAAAAAAESGELPAVEEMELELPEPTNDAIVSFDLERHFEDCGLVGCADIPALIDDLRLE